MYTKIYTCIRTYVYTYTHTHLYLSRSHTHTHTHTYSHTHTYLHSFPLFHYFYPSSSPPLNVVLVILYLQFVCFSGLYWSYFDTFNFSAHNTILACSFKYIFISLSLLLHSWFPHCTLKIRRQNKISVTNNTTQLN